MSGEEKSSSSSEQSDGLNERLASPRNEEMKTALNLIEEAVLAKSSAERLAVEVAVRESLLRGQKEAFRAAVNGESLETSLGFLTNTAIHHYGDSDVRGAFYLADRERKTLRHVTGMSDAFVQDANDLAKGSESLARMSTEIDEPVVIPDVHNEPGWEPWLWLAKKHGFRASWSFPIRSTREPVLGTFALYFAYPRDATERDLEFAAAITDAATIIISRYKVAEERAQTAKALSESEVKFRTMFESNDEGFCVIEMLYDKDGNAFDYRFLEANPAFEHQTGFTDAIGRTVLELAPEHEQFWIEIYGEIARTGVAQRFEHEAKALDRFYSVYAFRVGLPEEKRVAVVFDDISDRTAAQKKLRLSEERQKFLLRLSDALRPLSNPGRIKAIAARLLGEQLGVNRVFYADVAADSWLVMKGYESGVVSMPDGAYPSSTYGDWMMNEYRSGRTLSYADATTDERFSDSQRKAHSSLEIVSAVGVPLVKNEDLVAVMAVHSSVRRDWTSHEIALVEETAERTWGAVERARVESELRRSNQRMRLLIEGATDIAIFTTDSNGDVTTWNTGSERLFGYQDQEIIGQSAELIFTRSDRRDGVPQREMATALEQGRALDERWHRRKDGSVFFASGVMQPLGENRDEGFVKIARDITERIRADAAQREKELLQTLVLAQELERSRIARDLHDELGQQITALRLKLEMLSIETAEDCGEMMDDVKEMARKIDEGVDFLAWELRPAALDDLGLVPAIEKYVSEWSGYSGVAASFEPSIYGLRFSAAAETAIYRVVQESLNNVHKHALAKNASIRLFTRDNRVVLLIDDDGSGYDAEDPEVRKRGIGLTGMNERVKLIGGSLEIESNPGQGTTIYVTIPVEPELDPSRSLE